MRLVKACAGQQADRAFHFGGIMSIAPKRLLHIGIFGMKYPVATAYT